MGKAVTQLKLSSGRIFDIPVFSYHTGPVEEVGYGGLIKVYHEQNGTTRSEVASSQTLTDAEAMELFSLLFGTKITSLIDGQGRGITTNESYSAWFCYWVENSTGEYHFRIIRPQHNTTTSTAIMEKTTCLPIFVVGFNVNTEPMIGTVYMSNASPIIYNAYRGAGVRPYDHNSVLTEDIMTIDTYTGMKEWVMEHYSGNKYRNHCLNIDPVAGTITATYTEDNIKSNYVGVSGWATPWLSYDQFYDAVTTNANKWDLTIGINTYDNENPYSYEPATFGGGDGSMGMFNPDGVDPAQVPALPTLTAANIGFMSVYNPSASQLKSLSQFLWSNAFDIDSFKKLFSDPMQCIIGLGVVPVQPTIGGTKNVTFGDIDSGVGMSYISSEYVEKDMGYVSIDKLYGSFMDYNNTSIQIYLPYIGFRQLQPDDIIGGSIGVVYHINVIDGGCTAYIRHSSRGVLYQYSGSCIANIPLSSINYSGAIQNAVSSAISGATVVAGMATGQAPVSIMGLAGLVSSASNLALNSKGQVQRSGSVSGSAGLMGIQRPYVIIERSRISVPADMHKFVGNTTNMTMSLNDCSGFTIIDQIRMQEFSCTEDEKKELLEILHKGVIF